MENCEHTALAMKTEPIGGCKEPMKVIRCTSCGIALSILQDVDLEYHFKSIEEKLGIKIR